MRELHIKVARMYLTALLVHPSTHPSTHPPTHPSIAYKIMRISVPYQQWLNGIIKSNWNESTADRILTDRHLHLPNVVWPHVTLGMTHQTVSLVFVLSYAYIICLNNLGERPTSIQYLVLCLPIYLPVSHVLSWTFEFYSVAINFKSGQIL